MYTWNPCLELGGLVQHRPRLLEGLDERRAHGLARLTRLRVVAAALDQMVYEVREAEELVRGRRLLERLAGPRPQKVQLNLWPWSYMLCSRGERDENIDFLDALSAPALARRPGRAAKKST